MKVIYKQPTDISQKKKVIDIYRHSKKSRIYLMVSVVINILLSIALIYK